MILQAVFVFYVFTLINSAPVIVYNRLIYIGENDANYCETKYGNRSRVMEFLPNTTAEFNYPDPCNIYCYDAIKKKTVKTPREEFSYCGHNKFCVQSMCALSNAVILAHCKDSKREYNFGVPHPTIPCKYFCYLPKDFAKGTWEAINKQEGTPCSTALTGEAGLYKLCNAAGACTVIPNQPLLRYKIPVVKNNTETSTNQENPPNPKQLAVPSTEIPIDQEPFRPQDLPNLKLI